MRLTAFMILYEMDVKYSWLYSNPNVGMLINPLFHWDVIYQKKKKKKRRGKFLKFILYERINKTQNHFAPVCLTILCYNRATKKRAKATSLNIQTPLNWTTLNLLNREIIPPILYSQQFSLVSAETSPHKMQPSKLQFLIHKQGTWSR